MPQVTANGVSLEYECHGDPAHPPLLLIMGLGAQLTLWPGEFIAALVAHGYHVIRYDNRDIGLSTKFSEHAAPNLRWVGLLRLIGLRARLPYRLSDMAADAVALLDALGIAKAHVVGASMGGMIAQLVASGWQERVLSLTSIMSTTGNSRLPPVKPEVLATLMDRPANDTLEQVILLRLRSLKAISSPAYPADQGRLRDLIAREYARSYHPSGAARQLAAIVDDGDRRKRLRAITAPTLVIHGEADPLIPVEGGHDTAASIAGAGLHTIAGMGHDLPVELTQEIADAIAGVARDRGQATSVPQT